MLLGEQKEPDLGFQEIFRLLQNVLLEKFLNLATLTFPSRRPPNNPGTVQVITMRANPGQRPHLE